MQHTAADQRVVAFASWILRWRWAVILASIVIVAAAASGMQFLKFTNNYRVFFGPDNPQLQAFQAMQDTYTKNDNIVFVVTPDDGRVFSPQVLSAVADLTSGAWQLTDSIRVDSITNFQHTRAQDDDLHVGDLVPDPAALSDDELAQIREIALREPALADRLIAPAAADTAVSVTFQLPDEEAGKRIRGIVAEARALAAQIKADNPQLSLRMTGTLMMNNAFFEATQADIKLLVPLMYGGIVLVMLLLVRCVASTATTVVIVGLSIVTAMGLAGWAGIGITSPSASAPTVIMTLAVADCIHVIVSMFAAMRGGLDRQAAIVESLRINMQPIFLTSVTTAIGFLTMNFSDSPPFKDLGNITAVGVMAAWLLAVTVLPAMLSILPCRKAAKTSRGSQMMDGLANFVVKRRNTLLIGGALASVALLAAIPANELNDDFIGYFSERIEFRRDTDYMVENLTGMFQVHYSIPSGQSNGVSSPEYLQQLKAFADWYRVQPGVLHVSSITDTFRRLNKNLHGDDEAWYRLPEDRELAAQYLLLYEMSLPFGLDLNNQLNLDKSASKFTVNMESLSSVELRRNVADSEKWLADNAPALASDGVGVSVMFSYIAERNIKSMLSGAVLGLVVISLILIVALRSLRLGLLSLLPNLLPIGLGFGIWGLAVGQVNMAASVVSGMILGIVVDDTVHFLSKYLRARREYGYAPVDAVRFAFHTVGLALLVTTIILITGFAILAQSNFGINATMASLTSIGIGLALIIDFLLLPPLLILLDRGTPEADGKQPDKETKGEVYAH